MKKILRMIHKNDQSLGYTLIYQDASRTGQKEERMSLQVCMHL